MSHILNRQQTFRTHRGTELDAKSWLTEAPLRMLMNNPDPDVSKKPNAPVVYGGMGRSHLDSGSVASQNRETEAMHNGSDVVSTWSLLNTASGASCASRHHGGSVRMVFSRHAGMVIVCGDTDEAAARIAHVLHNDPATGVIHHADAGYDIAIECAAAQTLKLPMVAAMQEQGKA
ncbi:hypothetical protein [Kosakonia sacchari]|uniref:hypothetical protein n=1 Tax=Kosakonia sacchari TaxID=1158459 RepID=UPI0025B18ECB|nr:hypothetical protein [Kosakonia sacchari]